MYRRIQAQNDTASTEIGGDRPEMIMLVHTWTVNHTVLHQQKPKIIQLEKNYNKAERIKFNRLTGDKAEFSKHLEFLSRHK